MKRKLLSVITALTLCVSLCPTWALAADEGTGQQEVSYLDAAGAAWNCTEYTSADGGTLFQNSLYALVLYTPPAQPAQSGECRRDTQIQQSPGLKPGEPQAEQMRHIVPD